MGTIGPIKCLQMGSEDPHMREPIFVVLSCFFVYWPWSCFWVIGYKGCKWRGNYWNREMKIAVFGLFWIIWLVLTKIKFSAIRMLGHNLFPPPRLMSLCFETRPLIRSCMPKLDIESKHKTRTKVGYITFKNLGFKFKTLFFPHKSHLWNSFPKQNKGKRLIDFKDFINK